MKRMAWIVVGWLVLGGTVQAASFDCAKASSKIEHIICDDPELSRLDEELAQAYKTALQDSSKAEAIRQAQKQWIMELNGCADVACVQEAYRKRIGQLHSYPHTMQLAAVPQQALQTNEAADTACLTPKIDWRNYEWTLITGKREAVCKEMLAYLKSRPNDVAPPTCSEERLPPNGNWTRPESRILGKKEKQTLLQDIPDRWLEVLGADLLQVIRGDITRDGIPESLLAFNTYQDDYWQTCERSKRCVSKNAIGHGIVLTSDSYSLLPMNEDATRVNWSHSSVVLGAMLTKGELVYYKKIPYWLSPVNWDQSYQDDFIHHGVRSDTPYYSLFSLSEIFVGTGNTWATSSQKHKKQNFLDVTSVVIENDLKSNNVCRFGYFHRDNLKLNQPKTRR